MFNMGNFQLIILGNIQLILTRGRGEAYESSRSK